MTARVDALLLDALGTLVELPPPAPVLREELAARFGIAVTEAEAAAALRAEIAYYRRHFDDARDDAALAALRGRCAQVLRAALPPAGAVPIPALTEALLASLRFRAYPDAAAAISGARARGARVVVCSNWDIGLPEVLERVGLAPLVDGVVSSALVGARKPDAAPFRAALQLAGGVAPAAAVHVGDTPAEDVAGARAAGLRAILLDRRGLPESAGPSTITGLDALGRLLW